MVVALQYATVNHVVIKDIPLPEHQIRVSSGIKNDVNKQHTGKSGGNYYCTDWQTLVSRRCFVTSHTQTLHACTDFAQRNVYTWQQYLVAGINSMMLRLPTDTVVARKPV